MDDYGIPYQRKGKRALRKKRQFRVYKKGGPLRGQNVPNNK